MTALIETTYREVSDLIRAGLTARRAIELHAADTGDSFAAVQARFYAGKKADPDAKSQRPANGSRPKPRRLTAVATPATTADGSLAEALEAAAALVAECAVLARSIETDAAGWRAIQETVRRVS
jgi:hypothetical protein